MKEPCLLGEVKTRKSGQPKPVKKETFEKEKRKATEVMNFEFKKN